MEKDEIQTSSSKFPRRSCNSSNVNEEAEDGNIRRGKNNGTIGSGGGATVDFTAGVGGAGGLCGWPSSRIVRVSRASGGKDRHSKVLTSKGLRDRRVRLSVNTSIQFYDLQDRLGYDQPSKAVDWLLKVAQNSISELPPITTTFPDTPNNHLNDEKNTPSKIDTGLGFESVDVDMAACSSNSETSKGSGGGLSLSRSESRLKARERARGRASKEKENDDKEIKNMFVHKHHYDKQPKQQQNVNIIPQSATFTQLLSSTNNNIVNHHNNNNNSPNWPAMAMDYYGGTTTRTSHGFYGQIQLGNNTVQEALSTHCSSPFFTISGDTHQELHSFSLLPEHYVPGGNNNNNQNNEYNLNYSISSTSSAGFNRGTLQSNSSTPPLLPQIQRFSSTDNSGSCPSGFFLGSAPPPHVAVAVVGSHHQQHHFQPTLFDAGLQLFYDDGGRHGDQKGKG